ncbi:MAG TPA: maleylpyruvate isomerase family mycothiol-dependent enzyme [Micromonosporaceae bacterium]
MANPSSVLAEITLATERLVATCRHLSDADLKAPSPLPGWSRGHVLAHVSRNADGFVNLFTWARTGVETPQYPSQQARDADIEAGAPRPVGEQIADLEASARRFRDAATSLPVAAWDAEVRVRGGHKIKARDLPWMRLREVEIHHVDLDAGYTPRQWPAKFTDQLLTETTGDFARRTDVPPIRLKSQAVDVVIGVGDPDMIVSGEAHAVAAWLLGRSDGAGLAVAPAGPLPPLPTWR